MKSDGKMLLVAKGNHLLLKSILIVYRFVKSYKKFSQPLSRVEDIALDGELQEKSLQELKRLATALNSAVRKGEDTVWLGGVSVSATALLKRETDLQPLAPAVSYTHLTLPTICSV